MLKKRKRSEKLQKEKNMNPFLYLIKEFVKKFYTDGGLANASILSYLTLISFVPLVSIILALGLRYIGNSSVINMFTDFIFSNFIPETGEKIKDYIFELIKSEGYIITAFGVVMVLIASASLLRTIQATLDKVWGKNSRVHFLRRYIMFWLIVVIALPTITTVITITLALKSQIILIENELFHTFLNSGVKFIAFIITFWIFFAIYYQVTSGHVPFKSALMGAGFSTVLWYIFKWGFGWYIEHFAKYDQLYGSLGVLPIFLLWIYLVWVDVILGSEFSYFVTYYKNILKSKGYKKDIRLHNYYILRILHIVNSHYKNNQGPVSIVRIINLLEFPYTEINHLIERLLKARILTRAEKHHKVLPRREIGNLNISYLFNQLSNGHYEIPKKEEYDDFDKRVEKLFSEIKNVKDKVLSQYFFYKLYKNDGHEDND